MQLSYEEFQQNLNEVLSEMQDACDACGRDISTVRLMAVTKTHPVDAVHYASQSGLLCVGENRVQEAVPKRKECQVDIPWELIGHLQSNKARLAVQTFDRIQSVDSVKLIRTLDRLCEEEGREVLPILLQVNSGEDPAKFGSDMEHACDLLTEALKADHIKVDGLMTIAPLSKDSTVAEMAFERLRDLRDRFEKDYAIQLPELSMGMSGDLKEAIKHGSTMIRVGTALFGSRGMYNA